MTISENLYFTYDGVSSQDFGILNVHLNSGMYDENFLPEREVVTTKVKGRNDPYFNSVEYSPLVFELTFAFEDVWDDAKIKNVSSWLCKDFYKELYFSDYPDRRFYAMYKGNPRLIHNGAKQGYIVLTFETSSPFAFSPVYTSSVYDYTGNPVGGTDLVYTNNGDLPNKPTMIVEIISGSTFTITNNSNGGNKISFTGLSIGEILTIDNLEEEIETSLINTYRYDNMSTDSVFLNFLVGNNNLKILGNIKLQFKSEFIIFPT